jgi:Lysine methyltransferase
VFYSPINCFPRRSLLQNSLSKAKYPVPGNVVCYSLDAYISLSLGAGIELGAGSGLVSIVAASKQTLSSIVITDYPDKFILDNLNANVVTNRELFSKDCHVRVEGYAWGNAADHLL